MKVQNPTTSTPVGLIVLFLIYTILIALILVFSQQILSTIQNINPLENTFVLLMIIILPLVLLGAIVVNILRLIRERRRKNPGARLKTRLVFYFVVVALLSLIPQAMLSTRFVNLSINFWSNVKIVDVLEGGLQVALKYHSDKYENLKVFSQSPVLPSLLSDIGTNRANVLARIQTANPEINYVQVFDAAGAELASESAEDVERSIEFSTVKENTGMLPQKEIGNQSILRAVSVFDTGGKKYYAVLGIILKKEFNEYASRLTSSMSTFKQLGTYRDAFEIVVVLFYFLFSFPIFLLSILISFLLTGDIIRPIVYLEEATRKVAEGDFSFRILSRSGDELSLLVDSFNKMVSELASSRKKIMQTEKITTWQEIAQRLAHEVTNPLTPIKLQAERILKKYTENGDDFERILSQGISSIIKEVDSLATMLKQFKEFAKPPVLKLEPVNIRKVVEEAASMYTEFSEKVNIDYSKIEPVITIYGDPGQVKQLFVNLIMNAIQAIQDRGEIFINAITIRKGDSPFLRLFIKDTGTGIPEEIKNKIFDPYFTTKKDGTGLGLSIVEKIVFDHNGHIWFETKKGSGTTFYIDLPIGAAT